MKTIKTLDDVYNELQKDNVDVHTTYGFIHEKTNNVIKNMSLGRIWFNLLLPDNYPVIDEPVDKKKLNQIITDIYKKYTAEEIAKILQTIKKEAFKLGTLQPVSYSIDDLVLPPEIEEKRQKLLQDESLSGEDLFKEGMKLTYEYLDWLKENDARTYTILTSGAKGSPELICSMMIVRSSAVDIENEVTEPIRHALVDGYNIKEYFDASKTARRAFYIVAQGTAKPGELARNTMFANANLRLVEGDCKSQMYLELDISDGLENSLIGRFYFDDSKKKLIEITEENKNKIVGKTIKLRSPIYCKSKDDTICLTCYGTLGSKLDTKYIGLVAGSTINRATVEGYSMKAKHSLGMVKVEDVDFTKDIIEIR